jgi:hypothetical protein
MMKKILLITVGFTALLSSCKKLADINANPNAAEKPVTSALLTQVESQIANIAANQTTTPFYVQYFSQIQYPDYQLYSLQNMGWDDIYSGPLEDLQNVINVNTANPSPTANGGNSINQVQIARILKGFYFMTLTDRYGDVPYSEALLGKPTPKYDKQADIYKDLFKELKEAVSSFASTGLPITGDVIYKGDLDKWKRFANSLRMIMALNLSKVDPAMGKTEFTAALNDAGGYITDNAQNFTVTYPGSGFNNPFANLTGASELGISKTFADQLNAYKDPRVLVYGEANSAGAVKGVPYGLNRTNMQAWLVANPDWSRVLAAAWKKTTSSITILPAAYIDLVRAEASILYGTGEDAFALFKKGITDSWAQWGVTGDVNTYLTNIGVPVAGNLTLNKISEQIWLALYESSMFAWNEWRRTGVPILTPAPDAPNLPIPHRYGYPLTELSFNAASYNAAVAAMPYNGGDKTTSRVWWDK